MQGHFLRFVRIYANAFSWRCTLDVRFNFLLYESMNPRESTASDISKYIFETKSSRTPTQIHSRTNICI